MRRSAENDELITTLEEAIADMQNQLQWEKDRVNELLSEYQAAVDEVRTRAVHYSL
jgi:flagellar biosynthesis chaperone FliJ